MQQNDPAIGLIIQWKQSGPQPTGPVVAVASPEVRNYWNYWDSLQFIDGLLFKEAQKRDVTDTFLQFLTPKQI